ncbi:MAG: hypothetical protein F6K19_29920 [Cyanothece sp. SIO1E1]|nr:hypothetical protein [Cyanothece sp. SIO1E1]
MHINGDFERILRVIFEDPPRESVHWNDVLKLLGECEIDFKEYGDRILIAVSHRNLPWRCVLHRKYDHPYLTESNIEDVRYSLLKAGIEPGD